MTVRFYSSTATEKALVGSITSGQTTLQVNNTVGLPPSFPYTLAVDYEGPTEELVEVTSAAGPVLTIVRGIDGTSAASHADNARVRHTSSARDFADSRNHENSSTNIHGLTGGEEIVGTNKVQTLSNKTVVNLQGSLLNPDVTMTGSNSVTFTRTPAGAATDSAINVINGAEETFSLRNNGDLRIRNPLTDDTSVNTRRMRVLMSDGTTERFNITSPGMATAFPRAGTADTVGGFKVVDPGDSNTRKAIQLRDSTDAADRFVVRSSGNIDITPSDPTQIPLDIMGPVAQAQPYIRVLDSGSNELLILEAAGQLRVEKSIRVDSGATANVGLTVRGESGQTANLEQWQNNTGTAIARVRADGSSDFTPVVTTTGIFTAAAGWSVTSQVAVVKAGVATINIALLRTGASIPADAGGDLFGDPALGTISAAFRPHSAFAPSVLTYAATNGLGTGSIWVFPTTGDVNIQTWSTDNTISTGINLRITMTYPLEFS